MPTIVCMPLCCVFLLKKEFIFFVSSGKSCTFAVLLKKEPRGLKRRDVVQLVVYLVWDQGVARSSRVIPTNKGRLAQLVQSICLTSRGSAVRIRQRPRRKTYGLPFFILYLILSDAVLFTLPPFYILFFVEVFWAKFNCPESIVFCTLYLGIEIDEKKNKNIQCSTCFVMIVPHKMLIFANDFVKMSTFVAGMNLVFLLWVSLRERCRL